MHYNHKAIKALPISIYLDDSAEVLNIFCSAQNGIITNASVIFLHEHEYTNKSSFYYHPKKNIQLRTMQFIKLTWPSNEMLRCVSLTGLMPPSTPSVRNNVQSALTANSVPEQLNCIPLKSMSIALMRMNGDVMLTKICCIALMTVDRNAKRSFFTVITAAKIIKLGATISSSPVKPFDKSGRKMNFCLSVYDKVSLKSSSTRLSRIFHSLR